LVPPFIININMHWLRELRDANVSIKSVDYVKNCEGPGPLKPNFYEYVHASISDAGV
jgi:hypothetical protein